MRTLKVRTLDGTVKTVLIDESQPISNLMVVICTKIGITNHDEFSLVRNFPDEGPYSTGYSTLTLRRRERERMGQTLDPKMEQLKKKLKTDDDLDWVDHARTLEEQGIDPETETLLLRRKFFFSDHNVDSRDPVQLNLLYVQARNAIIAGSHPVTLQEAAAFAGLQCQIQFGDFVESKHRQGFLDLRDFLPKDYARSKGVEKRVNNEHRKQIGLSEIEAKVKYCQLARSLKTYGVSFFLVKEKMKGKNKLVPRLLGVTKDSVLRLDEKTKEIVKTWPLTTVKRWAASPNSFTLDFGDYSDSYYSVQTMEGEQISQMIAGYIDIILKKKKAKDHFGIEGDEGSTMVEDSVSPYKATILQHQTAQKPQEVDLSHVILPSIVKPVEARPIETGQITSTKTQVKTQVHVGQTPKVTPSKPQISVQTVESQRAFISNLDRGRKAVREAEKDLEDLEVGWTPSGPKKQVTFDLKKKALNAQLSAAAAATAHMIQLTSADEENFDYPALANAVQTVAFNLPEIARDTKILARLMEDESQGDELIDAARRLCKAFSDLLNAAEPGKSVPRQSLLNAASRVGEATHDLLAQIKDPEYDHETEDILLALAKAVANAAAALVLKGKDVASTIEDPAAQNRVISAATECALATGQLVATAKVVSPTIENPICQRQITQASKEVARSVEHIVRVTSDSGGSAKLIGDLKAAAAEVARTLNDLLNHVRSIGDRRSAKSQVERERAETEAVDTIYTATDRIFESQGDPSEMIRQAKILAKATVQLINDLKGQAEAVPDSDQQKRLIVAARLLADATARLVDAAKGCKSYPMEPQYHTAIKHAAEDLRVATADTTTKKVRLDTSTIDERLERKFEPTYEEIKGQGKGPSDVQVNQSETTFSAKITKLEQMSAYSELKESRSSEREVTVFRGSPEQIQKQSNFQLTPHEIHESHGPPGAPPIPPPPSTEIQRQLSSSSFQDKQRSILDYRQESGGISPEEQERNAIVQQELMSRARGTQACTHASSTVSGIIGDLETTMMFATAGTLNPENEHETFADHRENIFKTAKALVEDTKTLVAGAASSQEQLAVAAENAVITMINLSEVVKQGAASLGSSNSEAQVLLINAVKDVAGALGELIHATKNAAGKSVNDPSMSHLKEAAKVMIVNATSLLKTVRTVEDEHQRGTLALESTIEAIGQELRAYDSGEVPLKKSSLEDLIRVTKPVTLATAKAVAAGTSGKQDDIIVAANMGRKAIFDVLITAKQAAFTTDSYELRSTVREAGRSCAILYRELLQMVHQFTQRPSGATAEERQALVSQSRRIAEAVTQMVTSAHMLREGEGWVDPEDPTVIAETELLGAASSIDAAAKKLASLQPRVTSVKVPDEDMNFDEMILEAAKSIAAATAALVRAASAAQRELVATGRMSARPAFSSDDGQWSEGLISAARHVAAATHSLVEAANALVQGQASEERLISAAKQVASSTAQLLVACKVKADSTSLGMKRLQTAGNAVKKATENLVKAAQKAIEHDEEQSIVLSKRRVSGIAQEISFREAILKKERELAEAREKLAAVRRAKYRRPGDQGLLEGNY